MRARTGRTSEGPYRQSQRAAIYRRLFRPCWRQGGLTYPCFCSPLELEVSRKTQLAAGKPPRYAGTCRDANRRAAARAKRAAGIAPTTRFRVPTGRASSSWTSCTGRRASSATTSATSSSVARMARPAFFFSNAVDDAAMGVTHVLRGEDHLTNTPRQLLILEALGLPAPQYGHVSLIVGKRRRAALEAARRAERAGVSRARLSPRGDDQSSVPTRPFHRRAWILTLEQMARAFDPQHLGRAPARFDEQQLNVWQKEAVHRLSHEDRRASGLQSVLPAESGGARGRRFHRGRAAQHRAAGGCARRGPKSCSARRPLSERR